MITINQYLSKKDCRKAIAFHYFSYKYTMISPVVGIFAITFVFILFIRNIPINSNVIILIILGLFVLLRPILYIENILNSFVSNKLLNFKTTIYIDNNLIKAESGKNISQVEIMNLFGYRISKKFILIYIKRNQYMIIDKKSAVDYEAIINILNNNRVKKL